jgi:hypothetical protein
MNFDKAIIQLPGGGEQVLTPAEFLAVPLSDRINLMTAKRIKFYKNGAAISPLEAVRRAP